MSKESDQLTKMNQILENESIIVKNGVLANSSYIPSTAYKLMALTLLKNKMVSNYAKSEFSIASIFDDVIKEVHDYIVCLPKHSSLRYETQLMGEYIKSLKSKYVPETVSFYVCQIKATSKWGVWCTGNPNDPIRVFNDRESAVCCRESLHEVLNQETI
jgi:hypothetical protein